MRTRFAAAIGLIVVTVLAGSPAGATPATQLAGYQVVAQASVFQVTEDFPLAPAHPLVELDAAYSQSNIDGSRAHALASAAWPGSLAGNLGSLLGVLGAPTINQLNYPIRAEAPTPTGPTQTLGAGTAMMTASTQPKAAGQQTASAQATLGSVGAGLVTFGSTSSQTTANLDQDTGTLTTQASSSATNIDIAGVITIGSVASTAGGRSVNGAKPVLKGGTTFHDMKIAGQEAYVDASGVHLGAVGNPTGATALNLVNTVLMGAGMKMYFSSAQTVTIAGYSYYYPASILLYWVPPGDSNHDTITISLGGAATSMNITNRSVDVPTVSIPPVSTDVPIPPSPAPSTLQFPTPSPSSPPAQVALPATPTRPSVQLLPPATAQLAAATSHGLGAGWLILLALAALIGAVALPRVPALLRAATPACDREQPWPHDGPDRRS